MDSKDSRVIKVRKGYKELLDLKVSKVLTEFRDSKVYKD
jgi:hypothetical protein